MKILLIGAQGKLGQKVINELINYNNLSITKLWAMPAIFNNLKPKQLGMMF